MAGLKPARGRGWLAIALLTAAALLAPGCTTRWLAGKIVGAPNQDRYLHLGFSPGQLREFRAALTFPRWTVDVPGEGVRLSVLVVGPADYQLDYRFKIDRDEHSRTDRFDLQFHWRAPRPLGKDGAPRGTLLLLHGIYTTKESMLPWALALAQRGYRCVLVDLRGHGESTGGRITYGAKETTDLSAVIDELQRRGLADRSVGVLGVSYGAGIGLLLAARDERVGTVVALEPFSDAREAVKRFAKAVAPKVTARFPDAKFDRAVAEAAPLGSFSWADADVRPAVRRLHGPVLFVHGARDTWLPPENSRELAALAPKGSRLEIRPDVDHRTLPFRLDPLATEAADWFDRHLASR